MKRRFVPPAHEPRLSREVRRAGGVFYTPPEIVRLIVDLVCSPLAPRADEPLKILDPACGAGEFLVEVWRRLAESLGEAAANRSVAGTDIDPQAIMQTRQRLPAVPAESLQIADALDDRSMSAGSYDVVVGNPPYVNIRELAKSQPRQRIEALKERFVTARGNFDLYVLFIERALELLRPGGRCGLIIPNKWATLDYARPCRELLLKHATIEHVIDLSSERMFAQASVYPHVLVFRKELSRKASVLACSELRTSGDACSTVRQQSLSPDAFVFQQPLDVESRVPTRTLGELSKLSCGTAGYAAAKIASRLRNATEGGPRSAAEHDFITSGNIDRYLIRLGNVRYLNRTYERPQLPLDIPELSAAKRRLFAEPKIVIAGMSRRLEAAWDDIGLALGVQVFAASEIQVDPFYLLAVLNSKLLSYLFATRYAAKRLAGGYLAINKGQLVKLPIVVGTGAPTKWVGVPSFEKQLTELGRSLTRQARHLTHEDEADRLIYQFYRLTDAEIARVEAHFSESSARAA